MPAVCCRSAPVREPTLSDIYAALADMLVSGDPAAVARAERFHARLAASFARYTGRPAEEFSGLFGLDELPVKPRMRGWIHLYAFGVSVVCGIVLVVLAYSAVSVRAGLAITVYAVATCGLFGLSASYHRVH